MQGSFFSLDTSSETRPHAIPARRARLHAPWRLWAGLFILPAMLLIAWPAAAATSESPEQGVDNSALFESYAETLKKIHRESGVPIPALQGILASVEPGLSDDDPETTAEVLETKAKDFKKILEDLSSSSAKDPAVRSLHAEAKQALEQGKLAEAESLFIKARDKNAEAAQGETEEAKQRRLLAAEDSANAAAVALLQVTYSSYRNAIDYYSEAAKILEKSDPDHARDYRMAQVRILDVLASDFWDAGALDELARLYPSIIMHITPDKDPDLWGELNNSYGVSLRDLAEQRGDRQLLLQAVEAHRQALKAYSREKAAEDWAQTNILLGNALKDIGSMEGDAEKLREAAACYRNALQEQKQEENPEERFFLQSNLANVLLTLGRQTEGTEELEESAAAFRDALSMDFSEQEQEDRAAAQAGLGLVLRLLGSREGSADKLRESVQLFRESLKTRTRDSDPMTWASTQNSLGSSLVNLAEFDKKPAYLKEAIAVYRAALEERTRDASPNDWAATQNNLGLALHSLGAMEKSPKLLKEAEKAFLAALEEFTAQAAPPLHELVQSNLKDTRELLKTMR